MKKETMSNMMQRCLIICCVVLVALTVVFTRGNEAKAWDKKGCDCTLQSITLEIDGKEYKYEGGLEPLVVVEQNKDWAEFLSTIKIVDYEIVTSDTCTCDNHDEFSFSLNGEGFPICGDFLKYQAGVSTNMLQEDKNLDIPACSFYRLYFGEDWGYMRIIFTKEYSLKYELKGGDFPKGTEVPDSYNSYKQTTLPIPEREGYIFKGWTMNEEDDIEIDKQTGYGMTGDVTYTAHWEEGERIDINEISGLEIDRDSEYTYYTGDEQRPYVFLYIGDTGLCKGIDYIVSYKNNIEVADADSETPPTIIIRGVGEYKGTIEKTFSIKKATLYCKSSNVSIGKGDTLSTVDLSGVKAYSWQNDKVVPGTWAWSKPDTTVDEEIGTEVNYEATFTPTDTKNYSSLNHMICLKVKESVTGCTITFADEGIFSYTGEAHEPVVTVVNGEATLKEGVDYTVSYENNVNAAARSDEEAPSVVVKGKGDYAGTKKLTFTIEKGKVTVVTAPTVSAIEEGKKLSDSVLTGGKAVDAKGNALEGTFGWKDGTVVPTVADSGVTKYKVVFTPKDKANYEVVETDVVITVNKKAEEPKKDISEESKNDTTQPPSTDKGNAVGDKVADKSNKATYQVTKSAEGKVEVAYVAPTSKTKKVTIPTTVTLADGTTAKVTSIAEKAFKKNTKLQEVTVGKSVTTIGKEAFSGCKNLKKVKSTTNVTTIGEKSFYKCTKLEKITIDKKVNSIGKSAFQGCSKLKNIVIKTTKLTKKNVQKNAFKGLPNKTKIDVPNKKVKDYKSILRARGASKSTTIK